jgi:hypothetical protein
MISRFLFFALCLLLPILALAAGAADTQTSLPYRQSAVLFASDGGRLHEFGYSLIAQGDTLIVGAPGWNDGTPYLMDGAAYVLQRGPAGWAETARIEAPAGLTGAWFGHALALDGDTLAVSAPHADADAVNNAGAIYVFTGGGADWEQQAVLAPPELTAENKFGWVADLDGDTLIAATDDQLADDDAVYIFQRNGAAWTQQARLTEANPSFNFGAAVAVAGDVALVGDPGVEFSLAPENLGVVTIYTHSGGVWSAAGTLSPNDGEPGDGFGCAMDFDGQTAVIAACSTLQIGVPTRAYVFTLDGGVWTQMARLDPSPIGAPFDLSSVSYDGDRILLSAEERFYSLATYSGAAFLFERDGETWRQTQTLRPDDVEPTDGYVWDAVLAGDDALVSAIFKNRLNAAQRGAVYVFSPRPEDRGLAYLPAAAGPEFPAGPIAFTAYAGYGEDTDLYLVWPDGRGRTQLTHTPSPISEFFPAWSPDGARLAYIRETNSSPSLELVVLDVPGGTELVIPTPGVNAIHRPAWSPDGQTIAYDGQIGASYDVYVVAADGSSGPVNLTQTSQADESYPAWSPDGSRLVFLNVTTLATMKPDGSDVTPIPGSPVGAFSPDWSPDGTTILFHVPLDGDPALYTIPAGGGAPQLVITDAENGRWSPDGSAIVFTGAGGGLFRVDADGQGLSVVFGSKFALMPDWRP